MAEEIKDPNVAGAFYPGDPKELARLIDGFLAAANPKPMDGPVIALIAPHAGYGYSGQAAAYAYKLIKGKPYRTVVVMGPSHQFPFSRASVYVKGAFRTPLGDLEIDEEFARAMLGSGAEDIVFEPQAFAEEHSVEVQLPFLQRTLSDFKIVPVVVGDCTFATCNALAAALKKAIGSRQDVLVVVSSDMYHGYDWEEAERFDKDTTQVLQSMDAEKLYYGLREGKFQMCGGFPAVAALILSKSLGHEKTAVLQYTTSARVTGNLKKGTWTVGYLSMAIDQDKAADFLTNGQKKKLLSLARDSIETYLKTGKRLQVTETDPVLTQKMGAFVTLHEHGELRGCIGNLQSDQPLYLTIRDMAVEAAVDDPRFNPVTIGELGNIELEISVLSPLKRVFSADHIQMGRHGVLVRRGGYGGVYLPQVATETGWSRDEFLSSLCAHKAGLPADAWKDPSTELYTFEALVFSEKSLKP